MSHKNTGKGPTYGEFSFPRSETTWVRGYARGGKVSQGKVETVMHEFKHGTLHSGSAKGPKVKSKDQALAIAMSEGRKAARHAEGGPVQLSPKPNIKPNFNIRPDIKPKPPIQKPLGREGKGYNSGGKVPGGGVRGTGKLLGELMGQPKKNELGIDSRKYNAGGMVSAKPMAAPAKKKSAKPKGPPKPARGGTPPMMVPKAPAAPGGPMMKVGGIVKKNKLGVKSGADLPPKSMNVKARLSSGVKSVDSMKRGGKVKGAAGGLKVTHTKNFKAIKKYADPFPRTRRQKQDNRAKQPIRFAEGGEVHPDAAQDKTLIRKAVGMHDTQLHGGKHTNLSKLRGGGKVHFS